MTLAGGRALALGNCALRSTWRRCWLTTDDPRGLGALLQPVFETFKEGSDTADLKAAERLLATFA
jgi:hypothetical protein